MLLQLVFQLTEQYGRHGGCIQTRMLEDSIGQPRQSIIVVKQMSSCANLEAQQTEEGEPKVRLLTPGISRPRAATSVQMSAPDLHCRQYNEL
jgi:hypothetical protein